MSRPRRLKFHLCFPRSKKSGPHHDHHQETATTNLPFDSDSDTPPEFTSKSVTTHSTASSSSSSSSTLPLDLASALSSRRFFLSCPGRSNSLIDDDTKILPPVKIEPEALNGGVAVLTYSPDPYSDFRTSMQEMVEAQDLDISADWAYLQEMLTCYLKLNSRRTHKYIVGAFADLLMSLMMGRQKTAASGGYEVLR